MKNQELFDYIKQQVEEGVSKEDITNTLLGSGWSNEDIIESFSFVVTPVPVSPQSNIPQPQSSQSAEILPLAHSTANLAGGGTLMGQAWSIYKSRFWTLLYIGSVPLLLLFSFFISIFVLGFMKVSMSSIVTIVTIILFLVLIYVFSIWAMLATLYAIKDNDEKIGIIKSYSRGWSKLFSFWWVMLLFSFIFIGGSVLFIIPGILFAVWFFFAPYILIDENLKGMDALMKSKEYVKGRWWGVFGNALVISVLYLIIAGAVIIIMLSIGFPKDSKIISLALITVGVFITPFIWAYLFSLYKSLKETRGEFVSNLKKGRIKFIIIGWLFGAIIPLGILASVILVSLNNAREKGMDVFNKTEVGLLNTEITKYFNKNGVLPKSLKEIIPPEQKESNLVNKITGKLYEYNIGQNNTYNICTVQSGDKKYCIGDIKSVDTTKDISLLPKYGGVKKTVEQKVADQKFIAGAIKKFGSRKVAYSQMLMRGVLDFQNGDHDVAMRMFNEAWLIDPQESKAYLMMATVEITRKNPDSAISLIQEGLSFDEANAWLRCSLAVPYITKSKSAQDKTVKTMYISKAKQAIDKALKYEPNNVNCKKLQKILGLN